MKPVRRKIRRHFGLTAKQVAVRSRRPWYFQWCIAALLLAAGYVIAYWQFTGGGESLRAQLVKTTNEIQSLQTKVIRMGRQVQIEQAAQSNLAKELDIIQDENIRLKEDLLFYKNMLKNKRLSK
jgi:hypothetical protein